MGVVSFKHSGNFNRTTTFLSKARTLNFRSVLSIYGEKGVEALSAATPIDTGLTANSWSYQIIHSKNLYTIAWNNSNLSDYGTPIAILLQYGHGTQNGGYVHGRDYINPAIQPIFDKMADEAWKEVQRL